MNRFFTFFIALVSSGTLNAGTTDSLQNIQQLGSILHTANTYHEAASNDKLIAEPIFVEPVIKYEVRLNGMPDAFDMIFTEPLIKYDVRLNGMQLSNLFEQITMEPLVKTPLVLEQFMMKVDRFYAEASPSYQHTSKLSAVIPSALVHQLNTTENVSPQASVSTLPNVQVAVLSDTAKKPLPSPEVQVTDTSGVKTFQTSEMEEVKVVSKKQPFERKADKMIVNVDAMISNNGASALEVMEKTPGITIDKDGNISMAGKSGVLVLIDGKQTYMSHPDLVNYLKSLPSSTLDKLEVMTNPSAKYDASGNAGIINIITKKQKIKGFNGSLSTSVGATRYFHTNNALLLNYRKDKWNVFSTMSANYRKRYDELSLKRFFLDDNGDAEAVFSQLAANTRQSSNYNVKLGADFYAAPKTTFGVIFSGYYNPSEVNNKNVSQLMDAAYVVDSTVQTKNIEEEVWKNGSVNLNFKQVFDSTNSGKELTADVDFIKYSSVNDQSFFNQVFDKNGLFMNADQLDGHVPSDIRIFSIKTDYTQPIFRQSKIETGLKYSVVETENLAGYFDVVNGNAVVNDKLTNSFNYKEQVGAAYISFSGESGKWGYQTGLRAELTSYEGFQYGNALQPDSTFSKDYLSLFPTAYLSYKLNNKHQFTLSYGRRINRPDYANLNPFKFFLDKYTYAAGNPFLKPMYTNQIELGHSFGRALHTKLSYARTDKLITDVFVTEGVSTYMNKENYGKREIVNLNVSYMHRFGKVLTSNFYNELTYNYFRGLAGGFPIEQEGVMYLFYMNNQFTFGKKWNAELSGYYRTKGWEGQVEVNDLYNLNSGVQYKVLKNKGSLKLSVNNIFQSARYEGNIKMNNAYARFKNVQYNRSVTLSFNYRFGKPFKGSSPRKSGGATDEQNRVNAG